MPHLTEPQKLFIVRELACFGSPSEVAARVKEEFGIEVSRQQVDIYNPDSSHGKELSKKWKKLHAEVREAFTKEQVDIPIRHRSFRSRELLEMYRRAKARGNLAQAAQFLEQAAKEWGDAYTNRQKVTHDGTLATRAMTDEEIEAEIVRLAKEAK